MRDPITIKQELQERVSSLEISMIMLLNTLRRGKEINVDGKKHMILSSISDKELDVIEKLITRPHNFRK